MNARELAERLGGVRSGRQYKCLCPAHDDSSPSLLVFDGRSEVQVRCLSGCEPREVIAALRQRGLWDKGGPKAAVVSGAQLYASLSYARALKRNAALAQMIFDDARPITSTIAESYFDRRDLLGAAIRVADIRFHPRCPRGPERLPAVVIAMRSFVDRELRAIQRIYITGREPVQKAGKPMMLGAASGSAMQLHPLGDEVMLHVAEGLESGLAVWCLDHAPVWALGSASGLRSLPLLDNVVSLTIWCDYDAAGMDAANVCLTRWKEAGRAAHVRLPYVEGWDPADVWSDRLARRQ